MANLRNTLLLGATCVSLALSSAAFAEPAAKATDAVAIKKDASSDAGAKKAEHKKEHKAHKAKKDHKAATTK